MPGSAPEVEIPRRAVAVIGAGGNIGSHLVPHLARLGALERVLLVDPDRYEEKNLATQEIARRDVGRRKVDVQARRLRAIREGLEIVALPARVEGVPLGRLRSDVIVACLDSRISRQAVNQAAWRLGIPWIDAGVSAGGELLARVNVYRPADEAPCLECAWSDQDYELLEVRHPCQQAVAAHSTNAPSTLGSLAASLAAIECGKLLAGEFDRSLAGRQVILDAHHHTHFVTSFRRNRRCRFDHQTWTVEPWRQPPGATRLGDILEFARASEPEKGPVSLRLEGSRFLLRPFCANGCSLETKGDAEVVGLVGRIHKRDRVCPKCSADLVVRGWDLADELRLADLAPRTLRRTLASLGLQSGDVVQLGMRNRDRHLELA